MASAYSVTHFRELRALPAPSPLGLAVGACVAGGEILERAEELDAE
jgi:hypothetical protein